MANYYADSSVLVKRHVLETGTVWVQQLMDPVTGHAIVTTHLSLVELYSALNRRVREQSLTAVDYAQISTDAQSLFVGQYGIIPLIQAIVSNALILLERYPLRAYDAVQLASALYARQSLLAAGSSAPIFLSADDRLLAAAQAEGFVTDDPNRH